MISAHILPHLEEPKFRETATFQYLPPDSNVANLHDNMKAIMAAIVNMVLCIMTSNNALAAQTCIVGVVVTNESNMASYFLEAGNLNDNNGDVAGPSSRGSGDLFKPLDRSNETDSEYNSTTGRHLGFEHDYNSHTAFRDVLRHYT